MRAQLGLELKKQPRWLSIMLFVLLLGVLAFPLRRELADFNYIQFSDGTSMPSVPREVTTKDAVKRALVVDAKTNLATVQKAGANEKAVADLLTVVLPALERGDNAAVNAAIKQAGETNPHVFAFPVSVWLAAAPFVTAGNEDNNIKAIFTAMDRYAPDRSAVVDEHSAALNLVAYLFNGLSEQDRRQNPPLVPMVLLALALVFMALSFTRDGQHHNDNFERLLPLAQNRVMMMKMAAALITLNLIAIFAFVVVIGFITILPGHELGTLRFPLVYYQQTQYLVVPLGLFFARVLLFFNLWLVLLAAGAFCFSRLSSNPLVVILLLGMLAFTRTLHLDAWVPVTRQWLLPTSYVNLPALFNRMNVFADTSLVQGALVLTAWAGLFWVLALVIDQVKRRVLADRGRRTKTR